MVVEEELPTWSLTASVGGAVRPPLLADYHVTLTPEIRGTLRRHEVQTGEASLAPGSSPPPDEVPPNRGYLGAENIPTIALRMELGTRDMMLLVSRYKAVPWCIRFLIHCFVYEILLSTQAYAYPGNTTGKLDTPRWKIILFRFASLQHRD